MKTKAQITSFIIAGIILLIMISLLITFSKMNKTSEPQIEKQIANPIAAFMESCLEQVSEQTLLLWSLQSGYFTLPEQKLDAKSIAYYIQDNNSYFPAKETMKKALEAFIDSDLDNCFNDFDQFREQGFEIKTEMIKKVAVTFSEQIDVRLSYEVIAKKEGSTTKIKDTLIQLPYNFNNIYAILQAINTEQMKNPNAVPIGFLAQYAKENTFNYNLIYDADDIVIYSLLFENKNNKKQLLFNFAGKYSWEDLR